ncbi:MAG TPA: universal stress protein, partial [Gaiellaceae bacterium]|nr:universal stress protein [Gaiellaceae bacterium]
MDASRKPHSIRAPQRDSTFGRVLVGIDGTEPGFEACRQAAVLAAPDAAIEAVAVVHLAEAVAVGFDAPRVAERLEREADAALTRAGEILGRDVARRSLNGFVVAALLREIERFGATAIVLGSHGHRRVTEILIGGVAGG